MYPVRRKLVVQCKSLLEGDDALEACRVACTGCGLCVADAPEGLMEMHLSLPVIDHAKSDLETAIATYRCPTDAITWIERQQFPRLHLETFQGKITEEVHDEV